MSTIFFKNPPKIIATYSVGGIKEGASHLGKFIDKIVTDETFEQNTFEKAEREMLAYAIDHSIKTAKLSYKQVDSLISGDLLNQIISSSFCARKFDIPYIGIYNACSTLTEGLALGSTLVDGGYMKNIVVATGSHFATAERQYRYPLELGCVRPPQSQWTVTGAGSVVLSSEGDDMPTITSATFGKVIDYGVSDPNNMGSAMAPSAMDTIKRHLRDTNRTPDYYDVILTGDLGALGSRIVKKLLLDEGIDIEKQHSDCGEMIFNIDEEEFQGGSGAGCSAVVFSSYIYNRMRNKKLNKVLLVATGALLSTLSSQQGETIPSIAHAVAIENLNLKGDKQ